MVQKFHTVFGRAEDSFYTVFLTDSLPLLFVAALMFTGFITETLYVLIYYFVFGQVLTLFLAQNSRFKQLFEIHYFSILKPLKHYLRYIGYTSLLAMLVSFERYIILQTYDENETLVYFILSQKLVSLGISLIFGYFTTKNYASIRKSDSEKARQIIKLSLGFIVSYGVVGMISIVTLSSISFRY